MAVQLTEELVRLFNEQETVKILSTVDQDGNPHATVKQTLSIDEDGNLFYLELLESSRTNQNLVRSIWFNRKVTVIIKGKAGESYQIKGTPVRNIITGPIFQKHYIEIRERLGNVDLAAVWVIRPEEIINQTYQARRETEETNHPYFTHLDRLAK